MAINRHIFPNLNKVVVDSKNKHFRIIDKQLLCTSDDSLIAYCSNEELDEYKDLIQNAQNIGVTAGASTPDYIINKVIERTNAIADSAKTK